MFRITTHSGFSEHCFSWVCDVSEEGTARVKARWSKADERHEMDREVADHAEQWLTWMHQLMQLMPPGATRVGHVDDFGGYTILIERNEYKAKWEEEGSIDFGPIDGAHAGVHRVFLEIDNVVRRLVDYSPPAEKQTRKKRGPGRYKK